jgi:hypothetical protein
MTKVEYASRIQFYVLLQWTFLEFFFEKYGAEGEKRGYQ